MAVMKGDGVITLALGAMPAFLRQRKQAIVLDGWASAKYPDGEGLYVPSQHAINDEYRDLADRAPTPWGGAVVNALAQTLFLEGIRRPKDEDNLETWSVWQENRWDWRQGAVYRGALTHGVSYIVALPGENPMTGARGVNWTGYSAKKFAAFYDQDDTDEWPTFGFYGDPRPSGTDSRGYDGFYVRIIDETATHYLFAKGDGLERSDWTYISWEEHNLGVPPVIRYANMLDLDGRATGEVEPIIPMLKRIDQDTFDRLIVQRFGAWKVRYIAGMAKPASAEEERAQAIKLAITDLLVAGDPQTKFGTLDETQLDGFIKARDADLRDLSAFSQIPPHHLLGLSSNLQAEALAAATHGLQLRSGERKVSFGESNEQLFRISAHILGNREEAEDFEAQSRWRDTEPRSITQAADALGKMADQLHIPVEMLWERLPNWTDGDTERAKKLVAEGGFDALIAALEKQAAAVTGAGQEQPQQQQDPTQGA